MANALRKTANALSTESELLNVHADLKEISRTFDVYVKAIEQVSIIEQSIVIIECASNIWQADKTVAYWAERKGDDAGVRDFLTKVSDIDTEIANVDRRFALP